MPDVTEGLRTGGPTHSQRTFVFGHVSRKKAAPSAFDDDLFVILPGLSPDYNYGPCKWGELHGNSLPEQGAEVAVAFDDRGVPIVVWWDGPHS
jgi:hypothetical protein